MGNLFRLEWQAFNFVAGIKISAGLLVMVTLTHLTGESWLATALAAMFAWLANTPGPLLKRIGGMLVFAIAASALTLLSGKFLLNLWPNVFAMVIISFVCTLALSGGLRAFMVGWAVICWAIYGPFLVAGSSTENCLWAIAVGTGVVIILNVIGEWLAGGDTAIPVENSEAGKPEAAIDLAYVVVYSIIVAFILGVTTYFGWSVLKTDPTLMVGGAFFVLGFDPYKTWVAGVSRALGLVLGVVLGLWLADLLGPGLITNLLMVIACGLSFAAVGVHPGAWMFFFMIFVALGWPSLEASILDLTIRERFFGEIVGIITAMAGISILLWWQKKFQSSQVES